MGGGRLREVVVHGGSTVYAQQRSRDYHYNHNYNKIVKSDWLSTALISALIGQFYWTVRVMPK